MYAKGLLQKVLIDLVRPAVKNHGAPPVSLPDMTPSRHHLIISHLQTTQWALKHAPGIRSYGESSHTNQAAFVRTSILTQGSMEP